VKGMKQSRQRRHRGDIGDTEYGRHRINRTGCYRSSSVALPEVSSGGGFLVEVFLN